MNWRWAWARSRLTAIVASGFCWLILTNLAPAIVAVSVMVGVAMVVGWRTSPLLWWRFGARRVEAAEAEAVWRALVPLEWLRGRNQPRLWVSRRVGSGVIAPDPGQLVFGERLLRQIRQHQVSDREVCRLVVRALGTAEVNRSRIVATVEVFCIPWAILSFAARAVSRPAVSMPLVGFAWRARWVFFLLAAADLYGRALWAGLVMLVLVAVATVTTPRWNRAWVVRQREMADAFGREHGAASSSWQVPSRAPAPQREGVR